MIYSKIYEERVVMKNVWRTHERERMGGSQRSEGHGYVTISPQTWRPSDTTPTAVPVTDMGSDILVVEMHGKPEMRNLTRRRFMPGVRVSGQNGGACT
jgi:hypothetical protein